MGLIHSLHNQNCLTTVMNSAFLDNYFHQNPSFKVANRQPALPNVEVFPEETKSKDFKFEVIYAMNGSTFEIDKINGISRIVWRGVVDIQSAKELVTMGADSVEFQGYKRLLLDRSNLVEFDTEARVWIRELLKTRAKKIVKMVDKLAIVKATSVKGSIFSNFIATAIKIVMPNLEMQEFQTEDEALNWLT